MQCVILAGGVGSRMWPETQTVPKTLLEVGGRPFAFWQLGWLAQSGVQQVLYSIGHLGDLVRAYVGDGSAWELAVDYVDEGECLRGTGGALRLAFDEGKLHEDFLILYGDSWLQVDPVAVFEHFRSRPEPALMTVHRNDSFWDTSNVVYDGEVVSRYEKGLLERPTDMRWIDYGLLAFHRSVIDERLTSGAVADLAPLCAQLAQDGALAGFEVVDRFYEIGSVAGRRDLEEHLARRSPSASRGGSRQDKSVP